MTIGCISVFQATVIAHVISMFLVPEQIIMDNMPSRGILHRLVMLIPFVLIFVLAFIAVFYFMVFIVGLITLYAVAITVLFEPRVFNRGGVSMTKRGFI